MKTLVLGLGNPILTDDGIGWDVIDRVQSRVYDPNVTFIRAALGGLSLAELMVDEKEASGWERQIEQIKIAVLFYGDPVPYVGNMLGRWNEKHDCSVSDNP